MICLDTNIAIYAINRRMPSIRHRLAEQLRLGTEIGFPVVALFELRYGHARSDRQAESDRLLEEFLAPGIAVLPFEAEDAAHAGDIRAHLERQGMPIGHYDYLIAAQARRRGATLVTANAREFERVPGLLVADQTFDVFGYPVEKPFNGGTLQVCREVGFEGHDFGSLFEPGPLNLAISCDDSAGGSGGAWVIDGDKINSVTTYGYPQDPFTNFGPYFGKDVARLYQRAKEIK